jgi:hypothetical protein
MGVSACRKGDGAMGRWGESGRSGRSGRFVGWRLPVHCRRFAVSPYPPFAALRS